jgi:hypothetical protein
MSAVLETVKAQLRLHMPPSQYHASPGLSISRLKRIGYSPMHFQHVPAASDQAAPMHLGQAAHCAVLEPERFARDYVVWNRMSDKGNLCPRNGQHWEKFKAEHPHSEIVMPDEYEHALRMQQAVRGDKWAMRYLTRGAAEVSMRKFSTAAARYQYHLQWAWYHDGYDLIRHVRPVMKEIVVESKPPYAVVVYDIPDEVIEIGREEYTRLLELLADCERANEWPGPALGTEVMFALPSWAYQQESTVTDDITSIGLEA